MPFYNIRYYSHELENKTSSRPSIDKIENIKKDGVFIELRGFFPELHVNDMFEGMLLLRTF